MDLKTICGVTPASVAVICRSTGELATPLGSYAVWLYYHRFTKDTFYKVVNDYVKPRLGMSDGSWIG